jgi:hypothetical protein
MTKTRHISLLSLPAFACMAAATFAPAQAADSKGLYQTLFYVSCETYMQDRKEPVGTGRNAVDQIYVSGWLSAYNYLTPNTYDILPNHNVASALQWLDKFCAENPKKSVEAGLLQLTDELYPNRIQNYVPPPQPARTGTKSK